MCTATRKCRESREDPDFHQIKREAEVDRVVRLTQDGWSAREISADLGISERTVVRRRTRGRQQGYFEDC